MNGFLIILQEALMWVFDSVLKPVLIEILKFIVTSLIDIIKDTFAWLLYYGFTTLLQILKVLGDAFEFFAGTSRGMVNDGTQTVLQVMFGLDIVGQMFLVFTIVGIALSMILSIINVVKSMSDMTLEDKNPISKVLKNMLKSMLTFAVIPILCLFLLQLSSIVVNTIDSLTDSYGGASIDGIIWYNASLNASKNENLNLNGKISEENKVKLLAGLDESRAPYIKQTSDSGYRSYAYEEVDGRDDFNFEYAKFDYVIGYASAIVMILILLGCVMVFIGRVFELIVLYVVGPLFAATIANDGGEMFKQWKDMFIAKFIGSYGVVLSMRLYLIIVPVIVSGKIIFTNSDVAGFDGSFNSFIQLLLIVGGAYAILKSQSMILRMLSHEAAGQAEQLGGAGVTAGMTMEGLAKGFGSTLGGGIFGGRGGKDQDEDKDKDEDEDEDDEESEDEDGDDKDGDEKDSSKKDSDKEDKSNQFKG